MSRAPGVRGVASSHVRFQRRAEAVRRRPWRLAGYAAVLAGLAALLVWAVGFSPLLAVRKVEVVGVPQTEVAPIRDLADVPMGQPLARVDRGEVAARVAERATLADVSIERSWPATLVIHASPRVPVLVVKNPQGRLQVVDADGVPYARVSAPPKGVPVVTADTPEGLSQDALRTAVGVVTALPSQLQHRVSAVTVSGADLVTMKIGRTTVTWGGSDQPDKKLTILTALLKGAPKAIDVSAPDTPVTR